ncbi:MAG: DUF4097 family beta strand repeat-containing protein [Melioribacteraceae bacterium]|nr:DUF4097 family beta strand repeat-containing protein [Melioribacteraceae bacterium]
MYPKKTYLIIFALLLAVSFTFAQQKKEYEETFDLDRYGRVTIETYKGSITVDTWDKDEFYFHAEVVPDTDGWNNTSPEEQLERCEVRFNHSNDYVSLESDYKKNLFGSNTLAFVHYKIKMPKTAKLKIDDYKSETLVDGLSSYIDIESYKGIIDVINFSGELKIDTYKGTVLVDLNELNDDLEFDTYKGEIEIKLPSDTNFDFDFDLGRKGDFESDFDMVMKNYSSDDGARGKVNGGGPEIKFSTYKGEIELREK